MIRPENFFKFISQVDGAVILHRFVGENLEIKLDGCDWSDFNPEDKRAYSKDQYEELKLIYDSYIF